MALKGYSSYRGRQGFWRGFLIVVLVLILLAACAFLFLQRFITYSDDGSFRLELPEIPFLEKVIGEQEEQTQQNVNLVIGSSGQDETEDGEETQQPEQSDGSSGEMTQPQQQIRPNTPLRLVGMSALPGNETALNAELDLVGADGFVFTAKADEGAVHFTSAVAMPAAVSADAVSGELLGKLCAIPGVYTVAKINCFHDSLYAFANMEEAGICQSNGYIWFDYNLGHWLDPEKEAARRYVIDLALECAQLGFDELMLEDVCYPARGKTYKIDYSRNTMGKTDALVQFLTQLRTELEPYGVQISVVLTEAQLNGTAENADQTGFAADRILPLVDTVYAAMTDPEATGAAVAAALGDSTVPMLIPGVEDETAEGGWYLPR